MPYPQEQLVRGMGPDASIYPTDPPLPGTRSVDDNSSVEHVVIMEYVDIPSAALDLGRLSSLQTMI